MRFSITSIFCLFLFSSLLFVASVMAQSGPGEVTGNGTTSGTSGSADLVMKGETYTATVTVSTIDGPTVMDDGTRQEKTSHRFVFADGSSFTTEDRMTMTPTSTPGMYKMTGISRIVEGTGDHANARGQLVLRGDMNMDKSEADWTVKGSICSPCN